MKPKQIVSRVALAYCVFMVVWVGGLQVFRLLAGKYMPQLLEATWTVFLWNDVFMYLVALPALLLVLHFVPEYKGPSAPRAEYKITVGRFLVILIFFMGAMYAANIVATILLTGLESLRGSLANVQELPNKLVDMGLFDMHWAVRLFFVGIVPALGEEYVVRYVLRKKLNGCGDRIYIVLSGLLFGLFHLDPAQSIYAAAAGMVLAWVYVKTSKLWLPMLLHFIMNSVAAIVLPAVAGEALDASFLTDYTQLLEYDLQLFYSRYGALVVKMLVLGTVVLGLIITAIALFATKFKKEWRMMQPPEENGWPYTEPKPVWPPVGMLPMYQQPWQNNWQAAGYYGQPPMPGYPPQPPMVWTAYGWMPAPPPQPYYGQPMPQQPYMPPYGAPPPMPWAPVPQPYQPVAPPPPLPKKKRGQAAKVCLLNVGMILFLVLTLGFTAWQFLY